MGRGNGEIFREYNNQIILRWYCCQPFLFLFILWVMITDYIWGFCLGFWIYSCIEIKLIARCFNSSFIDGAKNLNSNRFLSIWQSSMVMHCNVSYSSIVCNYLNKSSSYNIISYLIKALFPKTFCCLIFFLFIKNPYKDIAVNIE